MRVQLTPAGTDERIDGDLVRVPSGEDLPEGFGGVEPVSRRRAAAAEAATDAAEATEATLASVLGPLGPILQDVRRAVASGPHPPHELTVSFGVQIGADLKLGIVGVSGLSSFTVTANWRLPGGA